MAFWRVRSNGISLIHGQREGGDVRQKVLHTFKNAAELQPILDDEGWFAFRVTVEQKHPQIAPRWEGVREQAERLWQERGQDFAQPGLWERQWKFRKALRLVSQELCRLRDPEEITAVGREVTECLLFGTRLLLRQRGLSAEEARLEAAKTVPDGERTEYLVQLARNDFAGSRAKAKKSFARAQEYDPFDPDTINTEGICWYECGQLAKARTCFEQARRMARLQLPNPDKVYSWGQLEVRSYVRATTNLALVHLKNCEYVAAAELLSECLQRCPDRENAVGALLATAYHRTGQLELALSRYREAIDGWTPDAYFDLALVLLELRRMDESVPYILEGLSINRWMVEALLKPGSLPLDEGDESAQSCGRATEYSQRNRHYWASDFRKFLKRVSQDSEVRPVLSSIAKLEEELRALRPGKERSNYVHRLSSLRQSLADRRLADRVVGRFGGV